MLTFEDVTGYFMKSAAEARLTVHPEYWLNSRTMEREFACTCHVGSCEEVESSSVCTLSFSWTTLDTALSQDGPRGICEFYHEPDADCPHLHTHDIPSLVLDLSYVLMLRGTPVSDETLLSLTQMLKLRASENSSRTVETRPGVTMTLLDNRLQPEALTLQQRVELPIWHPNGLLGLHDDLPQTEVRPWRRLSARDDETEREIVADEPHPEEWLPRVLADVCQDIIHVLEALTAAYSLPE